MTPRLSVLLPGLEGWRTVRAAIDAWAVQADALELVLLAPDADEAAAAGALPPGAVAVATGDLLLHQARALGVRRASTPWVMLAEDHCLPDPDFTGAVLLRIEEGWDAIGPALRPGNAGSPTEQASFLLGYGEWLEPEAGPAGALPGHNVAVRRDLLLARGAALEDELLIGAFLLDRIRREGARCVLEPGARMRHFDRPSLADMVVVFAVIGTGFGAVRTRAWPLPARLLYPLAAPLVGARHLARGLREYRRAGRHTGMRPSCLPVTALLATVWGAAEGVGALLGTKTITPLLWRSEVKPVSLDDVARSTG